MKQWRGIQNFVNECAENIGFNNYGLGYFPPDQEERLEMLSRPVGNPARIADQLCYRVFKDGIFYNDGKGDPKGFVFEIDPIVGMSEILEQNLVHFFNDELPKDTVIQFLLLASHKVDAPLDIWERERVADNKFLQDLTQRRLEFMKSRAFVEDGTAPRNFRVVVSVNQQKKSLAEVLEFQQLILRKFRSWNFSPELFDSQDLVNVVEEIVTLEEARRVNKYELVNLECCGIQKGRIKDNVEDGFEFGKFKTRCFRIEEFPEEFSIGAMLGLLGEFSRGHVPVIGRVALNLTIANNISSSESAKIVSRGKGVIHASQKWYSFLNFNLKNEAVQWASLVNKVQAGGKLLNFGFSVALTALKEQIAIADANLMTLFNINNWKLSREDDLHLGNLLAMLPMQAFDFWDWLKYFQFTKIGLAEEVKAMLPIHAEWKGVASSGVLLTGRRGQLFNFDPFVKIAGGNFNMCVFAPSGSGKSFFLQEFVSSMLAKNVRAFVLDVGGSYKNLTLNEHSEMIEFNEQANISLNPFAGLKEMGSINIEQQKIFITYAASIVVAMCGDFGNAALNNSVIEKAIFRALEDKNFELTLTRLTEILAMGSNSEKDLARVLFPFTENGTKGRWFSSGESKTNISFKKPLTVFEFGAIKEQKVLVSVLTQILSVQIKMQFLLDESRKNKFCIVVDEAPQIIDFNPKFFGSYAREVRKYGGCLTICAQSYSDFNKTPDHKVIFENSTWTLILKQNETTFESFLDCEAFKDMLPLIKSIKFVPGKYAEILIFSSGIKVVGRLIVDPFAQVLYSTDQKDVNFLQVAMKSGKSLEEAVDELSNTKNK